MRVVLQESTGCHGAGSPEERTLAGLGHQLATLGLQSGGMTMSSVEGGAIGVVLSSGPMDVCLGPGTALLVIFH